MLHHRGTTLIVPDSSCSKSTTPSRNNNQFYIETLVLIGLVCCMSCILSTVSYAVRAALARRGFLGDQPELNLGFDNNLTGFQSNLNRSGGLTEIECEALGLFEFSDDLLQSRKAEFERERERETILNANREEIRAALNMSTHISERSNNFVDEVQLDDFTGGITQEEQGDIPTKMPKVINGDTDSGTDAVDAMRHESTIAECECAICLTELEKGDKCRILPEPCGHLFHLACIDQWFQQSQSCPLCKRSIRNILQGGNGIIPDRPRRQWAARADYVATQIPGVMGQVSNGELAVANADLGDDGAGGAAAVGGAAAARRAGHAPTPTGGDYPHGYGFTQLIATLRQSSSARHAHFMATYVDGHSQALPPAAPSARQPLTVLHNQRNLELRRSSTATTYRSEPTGLHIGNRLNADDGDDEVDVEMQSMEVASVSPPLAPSVLDLGLGLDLSHRLAAVTGGARAAFLADKSSRNFEALETSSSDSEVVEVDLEHDT